MPVQAFLRVLLLVRSHNTTSQDDNSLGIIGLGRIGGRVLRRTKPFGTPRLLVNDIDHSKRSELLDFKLDWVSKEKIYEEADIITIHPEATDNLEESILKIKSLNKKVGVSLNPETKIDLIIDYLEKIDLVLIMSVNPGFGGQKFMPEVLDKIKQLKKIQSENNMSFDIEIDGGINFDNCQTAIEAGANILVSGTTVFKSNNGDIKKNINLLKLK